MKEGNWKMSERFVTLNVRRTPWGWARSLCLCGLLTALSVVANARGSVTVEYLCCAWGPGMTLPTKAGEKPQFDDSQEEVYFLKQVDGQGVGIYLCKMKADGSEKTEIKELWRDPNYPIDTQDCTTWMDVCDKTHQVAVTVTYAGSDITGLWTVNMDGSDLKRIITPAHVTNGLQSVGGVNWMPDGQWIVYGESMRGADRNGRIAKCDKNGEKRVYLTDGPMDSYPRVSPDGKQIGYIHWVGWASRLYMISIDGSDQRALPNPDDKRWGTHGGLYPGGVRTEKNFYHRRRP